MELSVKERAAKWLKDVSDTCFLRTKAACRPNRDTRNLPFNLFGPKLSRFGLNGPMAREQLAEENQRVFACSALTGTGDIETGFSLE